MTRCPITRRYATLFALSALAVAVAAPNAPAFTGPSTQSQDQPSQVVGSQDLRSPDTRDAAAAQAREPVSVARSHDLRSPDTRDAAAAQAQEPVSVARSHDLRSPDTRDAAIGHDPEPVAVAVPEPSGSGEGFDWVSAAIGAAAVGGLILLLLGFMNSRGGHGVGRIGRRGALHT
jgi:hypothetical protein